MIVLSKSSMTGVDQRQQPNRCPGRHIFPATSSVHARGSGTVEDHVVFLIGIHREVVERAD